MRVAWVKRLVPPSTRVLLERIFYFARPSNEWQKGALAFMFDSHKIDDDETPAAVRVITLTSTLLMP